LPKIEISDLKGVFVVRPKQTNRRILAQQGAFLLFGLNTTLSDSNELGVEIRRRTIRAGVKNKLLRELDAINVNASSLFPEIESAAKYITSKIAITNESEEEPN
jgi:hypothetical protein